MTRRWAVAVPLVAFPLTSAGPAAGEEPMATGWRADPAVVAELDRKKADYLYREELVPPYTLPDPLVAADGSRVATREQWEKGRRPETLELFRRHVYGRPPQPPAGVTFDVRSTDPAALDGRATHKRVRITAADAAGRSYGFEAAVLVPNERSGPVPAVLLVNHRTEAGGDPTGRPTAEFWPAADIVGRGYAAAVFRTWDVDPDKKSEASRATGVRGVWPGGGGAAGADGWATLGAWAWGAGRVLDYLRSDPAVDGTKVAVVGHSRGGKTALWAAAQDDRFALAVANDSGCGGAAVSRRRFGETVAAINRLAPHWFCGNFRRYDGKEDDLPVDQHQLIALLAPRPVYVASADADLWADPRGEFLALAHAAPVYALYHLPGFGPGDMPPLDTPAVRGRVGYHVRRGGHDLTAYDWARFLDFADRQLKK